MAESQKAKNPKTPPGINEFLYQKAPFSSLFKLTSKQDKLLMVLGFISAMINGALQPLFGLLFGEVSQKFHPGTPAQEIVDKCLTLTYWFLGIGGLSFILSWCMMFCWINVGEKQAIKFRLEYYKSLLQQEVGYFDKIQANEVASKVATECFKIQQALGEKVCVFIYSISMFIGSLIISFIRGWQMALIACAVTPIITVIGYFYQWVTEMIVKKTGGAYSQAGGVSEQAISSIRTVKGLSGENYELNKYSSLLKRAFKVAVKFSFLTGLAVGLQNMVFFLDFAITFWAGSKFIEDRTYNHVMGRDYEFSDVLTVVLAIMISSFELGQAMNSMKAFAQAQIAAHSMFQVLNRVPEIQSNSTSGKTLSKIHGEIEFKDVVFSYPTQPEIEVLKRINLTIRPNIKTAIVGESGSGKSTIIQLIERFYDPQNGKIFLDGDNLKDIRLDWLRSRIGYVGQEPVLFATSIRENLRYGKTDATEEQMISALKQANAWSFVSTLEHGLDTHLGSSGVGLSGGQKQRISIARALLKIPSILLLDEATSALDRKNEVEIQKTLDEVSSGLTTIVIAHRLATIKNSDEIIVISNGTVCERGKHDDLLKNKGAYFNFVEKQTMKEKEQKEQLDYEEQIPENKNKNKKTVVKTNIDLDFQTEMAILGDQQKEGDNNANKDEPDNKAPRKSFSHNNNDNITNEMKIIEEKSDKKQGEKQEEKKVDMTNRILAYTKGNQKINQILGCIMAAANGIWYPFCGWILGNITEILLDPTRNDFRTESNKMTYYFIGISILQLITSALQFGFFSNVAESITITLRSDLFDKILKMPIGWFDRKENSPGSLTSKLASDCVALNSLTTITFGINLSNITALISALILSFTADWRSTLVGLSLMPFMILSQMWYMSRMAGFSEKTDSGYRDSTNMINDTACNIRTVTSFGNPDQMIKNFEKILEKNIDQIGKSAIEASLAFAFTNFTMFAIYGVLFYASSTFHRDYGVEVVDMFIAIQCLMFASIGIGSNSFYIGDISAAQNAAKSVFEILDSKDERSDENGLLQSPSSDIKGEIEFKNVSFTYPTREGLVLKNFSIKINSGQKVAFVGPSGAGKSSIVALIQRFYDNYTGDILLDGVNIRDYDLIQYRKFFGIVSQEPTLFNGSIRENIVYNTGDIPDSEVIEITRKANAYEFISASTHNTDKHGLERQVGLKGNQLSGGQKQRIAICRALLKKPKIMLLDEATSALDSQNEQIVQASLDVAMKNLTSIVIAHRLSTIQDADLICVMEAGKVVEQGTYQQLLNLKDHFYRLAQEH